MDLALYIIVIVLATGIVWKGSDGLESSSIALAAHYALPPIVQGGIVTAIGSSFPELSSTVLSTLVHGEFELGVSIIVGSATIDYAVAAPMMGVLTVATIALFALMRTGLALTRVESVFLLLLYGLFVAWMGLETAGITSVVA